MFFDDRKNIKDGKTSGRGRGKRKIIASKTTGTKKKVKVVEIDDEYEETNADSPPQTSSPVPAKVASPAQGAYQDMDLGGLVSASCTKDKTPEVVDSPLKFVRIAFALDDFEDLGIEGDNVSPAHNVPGEDPPALSPSVVSPVKVCEDILHGLALGNKLPSSGGSGSNTSSCSCSSSEDTRSDSSSRCLTGDTETGDEKSMKDKTRATEGDVRLATREVKKIAELPKGKVYLSFVN